MSRRKLAPTLMDHTGVLLGPNGEGNGCQDGNGGGVPGEYDGNGNRNGKDGSEGGDGSEDHEDAEMIDMPATVVTTGYGEERDPAE
jgi:hypothetical protein